ncbi:PEGA domain-containing protein [bacterium]|nr:PEGA domain-containing protein [bacterium]
MLVKKRVILYSISFLIIVSISLSMVFVLKGYYFDFTSLSIKKGGSVFIKSIPRTAKIYVNGKLKRKKSPVNISLPTGTYDIKVEKDGFFPWQKSVRIDSGFVAWQNYVFLIRQDKQEKILAENINSFSISKNNDKVAYSDNAGNVYSSKVNGDDKKTLYENKNTSAPISILSWSEDSQAVLIQQKDLTEEKKHYILKDKEIVELPHIPGDVSKAEFKYNSNSSLVALSSNKIYSVQKDNILTEDVNIADFSQTKSNILYTKNEANESNIIKSSFDFKDKNSIVKSDIKFSHVYAGENNYISFIKDDSSLWIVKGDVQTKVTDNADYAMWSPESKKLLFVKNSEIKVYSDKEEDPRKPKTELLTRLSTPIDEIKWFYDEGHIIYRVKNIITFVELDGSNATNLSEESSEVNGFSTTKYGREFVFLKQNEEKNNLVFSKIGEENGLIPY